MEGKPGEARERIEKVRALFHILPLPLFLRRPTPVQAYVPTLLRNWGVFFPTQVVNFALVPPHLRFVFVGVVGLFWSMAFCYISIVTPGDIDT